MAKARAFRASDCRKVKAHGRTWYCCCGKSKKKIRGKHRPACVCAPMVGKNKVATGQTVKFWVDEKGKTHKLSRVRKPRRSSCGCGR